MIRFPRSVSFERPVPTMVTSDPVELSDDCMAIAMTSGDDIHVLTVTPLDGHALVDLAVPFAAGEIDFVQAKDLPGMPPGKYILMKHEGEAIGTFFLGNG